MFNISNSFNPNTLSRQHGASSAEFTMVAIAILFVALCVYEITRAQTLKQIFQQALQESARTAAVLHVNPSRIEQRLNEAMLAWWARKTPASAAKAQQRTQLRFKEAYQLHPWQITILSPNTESFKRYADNRARLAVATPYLTINNHYQYEHHHGLLKRDKAAMFSAPAPLLNTHTILDANTISLEGIYLYEPSALPVRVLIAAASRLISINPDGYAQEALHKGLIPLQVTLSVGAQSHPIQWPIKTNQPVQRAQSSSITTMLNSYGQTQ